MLPLYTCTCRSVYQNVPLCRGVLYSECHLLEFHCTMYMYVHTWALSLIITREKLRPDMLYAFLWLRFILFYGYIHVYTCMY